MWFELIAEHIFRAMGQIITRFFYVLFGVAMGYAWAYMAFSG